MLRALRVIDRVRLILQTQYLAGSLGGVLSDGTVIVLQNQWDICGYSKTIRKDLMSLPQHEKDRWANIYGAGSIGFALHDNMQREDFRKFIVKVAVKQFIYLEDTCIMFSSESLNQTPNSSSGVTASSSAAMTSRSMTSAASGGATPSTMTATGNIAVPLRNTATADSYGLGVSSSGTGTMRAANFFDALPCQIRGRTANQAISSGGGAGISTITDYDDSLPHQIIGKHKNNGCAMYQLLPVP
jgi:hypothetical protein